MLHTPDSEPEKHLEKFSCLTCRQRKVRCDRTSPCSNCTKAGASCTFVAPTRGKRKRRKAPKEGLHAKLRCYEDLLRQHGTKFELDDNADTSDGGESVSEPDSDMVDPPETNCKNPDTAAMKLSASGSKLIQKNGSSRYLENGLWSNMGLGEAFSEEKDTALAAVREHSNIQASERFAESPDETGLLLCSPTNEDLAYLHPPSHVLQKILDIYTDRVDAVLKILHFPTFHAKLMAIVRSPHDVPKNMEAAVFSFYLVTINTLEKDEWQEVLGEPKSVAYARYKRAARQALTNAGFIKSPNLLTLQAFVMFLMGVAGNYASDGFFVLTGIALRLARRIGLHRDGTTLGLSPFETEMRRRLWWQIVRMECHASDFSGAKPSFDIFTANTKPILNIEDEDISPDMANLPPERVGITSAVMSLMRCHIFDIFCEAHPRANPDFFWNMLSGPKLAIPEKDSLIRQAEEMLEMKYLRYCDPSEPLHQLTSVICRSAICKMKLFAHSPRQYCERGVKVPQQERDIIFVNATKLLEYGNMLQSVKNLRKYMWVMSSGYLWDTLMYVLIELRHRKTTPEVVQTWKLIDSLISNYPEMFEEASEALYAALGNWTLQVWDECVTARRLAELPEMPQLNSIVGMRQKQRPWTNPTSSSSTAVETPNSVDAGNPSLDHDGGPLIGLEPVDSYSFSNLLSFDLMPNEWAQWERLFAGQDFS